ncbi:MAG TPA: DUF308 domain-containing protein [Gemmatimonadaceae bacterium]|jgi:uncharacterized membrane protein HdeD (DUF308 family)
MVSTTKELSHLSHTLISRGAMMLGLGLVAVIWPEQLLVFALLLVGTIAALLGLYEVGIALALRQRALHWQLVLLHGLASIAFGFLTMGSAGIELSVALRSVAVWLCAYALLAIGAARLVAQNPLPRWGLVIWAALNVSFAILAVVYPEATIFALLFVGAGYAALYGAWQLVVGLWLRRSLRHHRGSEQHLLFVG